LTNLPIKLIINSSFIWGAAEMEQEINRAIKRFIAKHGLDAAPIDIGRECDKFISEMNLGLGSKPGSLKMLPAYLTAGKEIPVNEPVLAIDAGGTNFRACIVRFDGQMIPSLEDLQIHPMPGSQERMSSKEFFDKIAEYISPLLGKAERMGFCFSYPMDMMANGDGNLIRFTKEMLVEGVEGRPVMKGLLDTLKKAGKPAPKSFMLLSDTVATLLGGQAARPNKKYSSYIGFILGTGLNTCYIESNA
jgi:hexokinase